MTRDEDNRRLAELVGYTFGDDGLCIEPTGHYNVPVPDFYEDEAASAMLLDKMPNPYLVRLTNEWECAADNWYEARSYVFDPDRKAAIVKAGLAYLEAQEKK